MCFLLYVGTDRELPLLEWDGNTPSSLAISSLTERERPVKKHFEKEAVQNVGSTSGCGCDFPFIILNSEDWPWWDGLLDASQIETEQFNRTALIKLLQSVGDSRVEIYGLWDGKFQQAPKLIEDVDIATIQQSAFRFKEQVLYRVTLLQPLVG